jgi:hypothetical protein
VKKAVLAVLAVGVLLQARAADGPAVPPVLAGKKTYSVLLVGNSYTKIGTLYLADVLTALSDSSNSVVRIRTSARYASNTDLKYHWNSGEKRVRKGKYDALVLQEHSQRPLNNPQQTIEYVAKFKDVMDAKGGKVVLLMFWSRRNDAKETATLSKRFTEFGKELGVPVAPVGLAWQRALKERPGIELYRKDGSHPTQLAFYLNACVLYAAFTGHPPEKLGNGGVEAATPELQRFLQDVAWQTVKEYYGGQGTAGLVARPTERED